MEHTMYKPSQATDFGHTSDTIGEHISMTQHSLSKGLKIYGDAGVTAVVEELNQLHEQSVIVPIDSKKLTWGEKQQALYYLMFLKEDSNGTIKARGCAYGRNQHGYMTKHDMTSSPTVAMDSLILSCVIDADERRDVATVNIPGAFLHIDMPNVVYMRIERKLADLLLDIDPETYGKFVQKFLGKSVIYVQLKKALYGTHKTALLFWEKLSSLLKLWGFVINSYDSCVANKEINGKLCTILWHVNDLKISHVEPDVVTEIIDKISAKLGKEAPLIVHRGKVHDYLGMTLNYESDGKIRIIMDEYISKIVEGAPEDMKGVLVSPATNYLFTVNKVNPVYLNEVEAEFFHHTVAKLLFLCKRARPDILTAISFLCSRVRKPDCDDYKKLARVIKYLRGTVDLFLTLEASNTRIMRWWVDASYGVHPDLNSHRGGMISHGKGAACDAATCQKEAELVGVHDVLSQVPWTKYFLQEQGYSCDEVIVHQVDTGAMLLENNGQTSGRKGTCHIHISYYFVTDRISSNEDKIKNCATKEIVAEFFTKPLQGLKFTTFRDFMMNIPCTKDCSNVQAQPLPVDVSASTEPD